MVSYTFHAKGTQREQSVLILVVMEDGLVLVQLLMLKLNVLKVLILVVMEDGLVQ